MPSAHEFPHPSFHPSSFIPHPSSSVKAQLLRNQLSPQDLAAASKDVDSWLWHGYLAAGKLTLLTSQWKSGKTTLISVLLARMGVGGQVGGLGIAPARAAVVSEEGPGNWDRRCRKLNIGNHVSFFCRPFAGRPQVSEWQGLLDAMLELRLRDRLNLVVIDPLAVFLPGHAENSAAALLDCLLPLARLTSAGLSVLLAHHPRKGVNLAGQQARGSGALAGHADILIEMNWFGRPEDDDRRRWLRAYSRHDETRRSLLLELTPQGDDYSPCDPHVAVSASDYHNVLRWVLADAGEPLTQRQILAQWPEDFHKPDRTSIGRALLHAVEHGEILRDGSGRRTNPFRYQLATKEDLPDAIDPLPALLPHPEPAPAKTATPIGPAATTAAAASGPPPAETVSARKETLMDARERLIFHSLGVPRKKERAENTAIGEIENG